MKWIFAILLVICITQNCRAGHPIDVDRNYLLEADEVETAEDHDYRLPNDINVSKYEIVITPYFEELGEKANFTFDGKVVMTLSTNKADVNKIVLHARNLEIKDQTLKKGDDVVEISKNTFENTTEKLTFELKDKLEKDTDYTLTINYVGYLGEVMKGFYRSSYHEQGQQKWLGTTQFQQTDARRAFPCLDEPGFKSKFLVTISRPKTYSVTLANTVIDSTSAHESLDGYMTDKYKETPLMSTYLIAFVVSEFKGRENNETESFGVYARPEMYDQTKYAFDIGMKILKKFGEYLDQSYYDDEKIMTKMHMVAIPDFSAGAMENWGLLTYRETGLLFDEKISKSKAQQSIANVISHEIIHMWFGNLLTCQWWEHTWLNEGFARYFQYFGTAMVQDDWDLDLQFVVEQLQGVFQFDSTESTHPMSHTVNSPSQVSGIFDNISYNKGGVFLRMMRLIIGDENFQKVLRKYVKDNLYKSVVPDNLFNALESVMEKKYTVLFKSFTEKAGYPLIHANYSGKTLTVSQKRFFIKNKGSQNETLYNVPITYATSGSNYESTVPQYYLMEKEKEDFEMTEAPKDYIILNVQQAFFYRVNYDLENWEKIGTALKKENHDGIHVLNRAQIVDDLFNLARGGVVKYPLVLDTVDYLVNETHYIPWQSALTGLSWISRRFSTEDDLKLFSFYINHLTKNIYQHLIYSGIFQQDRRIDIYNRVNIMTWLCKYGHEDCLSYTKLHFANYQGKNDSVSINGDYRPLVYCYGIRQGGADEFSFLKKLHAETLLQEEGLNILQGLACTKDQKLMDEYLQYILTDAVRVQDRNTAFSNAYTASPDSYKLVFNYIKNNFKTWSETMSLTSTLSSVADRFVSQKEIDELNAFIDANNKELGDTQVKSLKNIAKTAEMNLEWDEKNLKEFKDYIRAMSSASLLATQNILMIFMVVFSYFTAF